MADPDLKEDLPFRHYTLKHRLIAWISMHLFGTLKYTVRHGLLKGMKRKGGLGWVAALFSPGIMTAEQQFWCGLNLRGMTAYDIGAFEGLLTLFFASRAKAVVSFEPNTQNNAPDGESDVERDQERRGAQDWCWLSARDARDGGESTHAGRRERGRKDAGGVLAGGSENGGRGDFHRRA
jgi:hypothetical protein